MKDFFTAEDFYSKNMIQKFFGSPVTGKAILCSEAAVYANEKLNKLIESMPVVYGCGDTWVTRKIKLEHDEKSARLAFIEELPKEPCKHSPIAKINDDYGIEIHGQPYCEHCGVELQATWSEKK